MKLKTFYRIYYRHRVEKASYILKFYLFLIIPFVYFMNIFFFQKKINLDLFSKKNFLLFEKNLNFLFEFFNSDKGEYYIDQYIQPIKRKIQSLNFYRDKKIGIGHDKITPLI